MPATANVTVGRYGHRSYPSLSSPALYAGISDPTVDNDATQLINANDIRAGAFVGDRFINATTRNEFVCLANGVGDASWWPVRGGVPVTKTNDYVISAIDCDKTFTTAGASGTVTFSLPAATPGLRFKFHVGAAQQLRVDPNGVETISLPSTGVAGAAGKYLVADAIGETLAIECVVAGAWSVFGHAGSWTHEL